jgi:DNA-binding CsgD family transcriptional regulator/tetratricopeptide (TPR) repeat protein
VTYRDDEIGRDHPLRLLLGDLATSPTVHRLSVLPLSEGAVHTLAAGSGQDPAALHRLTGGNPFFLSEVLATAGELIPATVKDAVLARAARLTPEVRAVLDVAAVIGSPIDLNVLREVAGPVLDETDACIASGLLRETNDGLAFRHELVREAVLTAIASPRRRLLHARVLAALRDAPESERDLARLAHHAEAAGDREATLELATAAAEQAAAMHAHYEAAAQFARALRFANHSLPAERARLFEGRSIACHLSDQGAEAIAARQSALDIWRSQGDPLKVGESLRWMSLFSWSEADGAAAEHAATAALETLEPLPPGPELAMAYSNLGQLRMLDDDLEGALRWSKQAMTLAEQLGETGTLVHALANIGSARLFAGDERGDEDLTRSLHLAIDHGLRVDAGRALNNLAWASLFVMRLDEADRRFATAIAYSAEYDLDVYHWHILAGKATLRAWRGARREAEQDIRQLLQRPRLSPVNRIMALATLGRVCARRGDPEAEEILDDALALADGNGQLMRLWPVRAARAEAALLGGDRERARNEVMALRDLVLERGNCWQRGELAWLLWQASDRDVPTDNLAEPFALQIAGDFAAAAAAWRDLGCPYEEARAQAESDDSDDIRRAIDTYELLGAKPALDHAIRHLRELGVRDVPPIRRGPRASTRANPAGLTTREVEVLGLLADGLRNAEIAERLYLTPKTVRHHVSSIFGKLGVETRIEAARAAARLGIPS